MTCLRYWDEGVALLERGEPDPHRDGCADCQREHAARERILRALPLIASGPGDPGWEAEVWRRLAVTARRASRGRSRWLRRAARPRSRSRARSAPSSSR